MTPGRLLLCVGVTVILTGALGALSRLPVDGVHADRGALRFSWRLRAEEAGECRRPTAEELQDLPAHMRNPDACAGQAPAYRLRVEVDGEEQFEDRVEASGVRGDRPLFVYRELLLAPGRHEVRVRFAPETGDTTAARRFHLDTLLSIEAGDVRLVTRNEDTGALEVVRPRG